VQPWPIASAASSPILAADRAPGLIHPDHPITGYSHGGPGVRGFRPINVISMISVIGAAI
jgi:hypothetical protein